MSKKVLNHLNDIQYTFDLDCNFLFYFIIFFVIQNFQYKKIQRHEMSKIQNKTKSFFKIQMYSDLKPFRKMKLNI